MGLNPTVSCAHRGPYLGIAMSELMAIRRPPLDWDLGSEQPYSIDLDLPTLGESDYGSIHLEALSVAKTFCPWSHPGPREKMREAVPHRFFVSLLSGR